MKAQIKITGQIMSVSKLFGQLVHNAHAYKDGNYDRFLFFDSVKEAKQAIGEAYTKLKEEDLTDFNLSKSIDNSILTYNAGRAELKKCYSHEKIVVDWQEL